MNVTNYINTWEISVTDEELELLISLEVDCIMCDWKFQLVRALIEDVYNLKINYVHIDLVKNGEHYLIQRMIYEIHTYKLVFKGSPDLIYCKGSMVKCIEYFKKNLF